MTPTNAPCVVGLGNPGRRYRRTRHNLGFMVVERLVEHWSAGMPRRAFDGLLWQASFGPQRVRLLQPMTFMNRSGRPTSELVRYYRLDVSELLIVLDDMALPPGTIRLRQSGSAGGHNGLADVLDCLGSQEISRLRLGIGEPPANMDGVDYVLGKLTEEEMALANQAIEQACQAVEDWLTCGIDAAMNKHN